MVCSGRFIIFFVVVKYQIKHDKMEASCKEAEIHCQFVNGMLRGLKKGKRFILFPKPPHLNIDKTILVFGMCFACRESLEVGYVVGSFMLECRHQCHPLFFSALLHTSSPCVKEGCGMVILAMARAWIGEHYAVKGKLAMSSIH